VVFYDGASIDVGEAVAETLLLNLDPYPRAPGAEQALRAAGVRMGLWTPFEQSVMWRLD